MSACEKTGYVIELTTNHISYSDVQQFETVLTAKDFKLGWRERTVETRYPGEVYTVFGKELSDKAYSFVEVYLYYVKDAANDRANHLLIRIVNRHAGLIIPEVKAEIDRMGDLIYQELSGVVGKENVKIERKEVSPPQFY